MKRDSKPVVRMSYISVSAENKEKAELDEKKITEELNEKFK